MRLVFSGKARADLKAIVQRIKGDNPARALSFVAELETRCGTLVKSPEAYAILPRYAERGIRRVVHGNYLIFYRVEADQVVVLRVLHGSMDLEPLLQRE